uniref:Uncharacterized protein n=1 Tax=Leersia perrieri TaxID=77586 RepID=A0A0D9XXH7_9ORYZ
MAAATASSDWRAEVDTSSAFRSVKEAVAVFGERILVGDNQFRRNGGDRRAATRSNTLSIAATFSKPKLDAGGDGVTIRLQSKPNDGAIHMVPSSPPPPTSPALLASSSSSPSLAGGGEEEVVMRAMRKVEEEAARARQEVAQLKRRISEMELAMATLSAKLHRALSKVAHMEADRAAAERARIVHRRDGRDMALAVWASTGDHRRRAGNATAARQPLRQLLRLGEADDGGEVRRAATAANGEMRKVQKQKPIVPLVVPLINGIIFSRKKRSKDKESLYMKELYSLLRLS